MIRKKTLSMIVAGVLALAMLAVPLLSDAFGGDGAVTDSPYAEMASNPSGGGNGGG
jgi:hypothetical protein